MLGEGELENIENPVEVEAGESDSTAELVERPGYLEDFISGLLVRNTPEERDAVQVLARRLVQDYDYSKDQIQTHPQFRVRKAPSDEKRSFPVDIAIFTSSEKTENHLFLIAECKQPNKKKGLQQLKRYLELSPAEVGVWFNGDEHTYIRKIVERGRVSYLELPNIPRKGQRIEDIGQFTRRELRPPSNLRAIFRDLRNHLAGTARGITRDEALAEEIINLLFCKIYDEVNTAQNDLVTFRAGHGEMPEEVRERVVELLGKVKTEYSDVFEETDSVRLDAKSIVYVVGELQNYAVTEADRDAIGDAFEVFIGPALRGQEGQFFTPRNVVRMMIEMLDPEPDEFILDPACGSGGFLIIALEYVWRKLDGRAERMGWSAVQLDRKRRDIATKLFRGIDKDSFLSRVTKAYMALVGDGRSGIFCENSLLPPSDWRSETKSAIKLGMFDVVLTNPPFGAKIKVEGEAVLSQYHLGHKWQKDRETGDVEETSAMHETQPPQIVFVERCLQFLRLGGRMGIVLPEAVFGMPTYEYVVKFLMENARILGVVSMPEALFKTSGKGGTHAKVCVVIIEKTPPKPGEDFEIFMAEAKWCGHDSRGNPTIQKDAAGKPLKDSDGNEIVLDDVPKIAERYRELLAQKRNK